MTERPLHSKSSIYFERYAMAERQNMSLGLTVYLLGGVCVALAAALVLAVSRPKPIHYVPAMPLGGTSYPQRVPASSALSFASSWIMNWCNYTPETVSGAYNRAMVFMSPALLSRVKSGLDDEFKKIAREQISSVFMLKDEPRVVEAVRGFEVVFEGVRGVYAGKEEMLREDVRFIVDVKRAATTEANPYGLMVDDLRKERAGHEAL